jgi:hypothetical protein
MFIYDYLLAALPGLSLMISSVNLIQAPLYGSGGFIALILAQVSHKSSLSMEEKAIISLFLGSFSNETAIQLGNVCWTLCDNQRVNSIQSDQSCLAV